MSRLTKKPARKKVPENRIDGLTIQDWRLFGIVSVSQREPVELLLVIDGVEQINCLSGRPVSWEGCHAGKAKAAEFRQGFFFPLPASVFDGAPHLIEVQFVADADVKGSIQFQSGSVHGQVACRRDGYAGWIEYRGGRNTALQFTVTGNDGGGPMKYHLALPTQRKSEIAAPVRLSFNVPFDQAGLPPRRFFCEGKELAGSPCQLPRKPAGRVEHLDSESVRGWALDVLRPTEPIELTLRIDGRDVMHFRPNLRRLSIGRHLGLTDEQCGVYGFQLSLADYLLDNLEHRIDIGFSQDGALLQGSGQRVKRPIPHEQWRPSVIPPTSVKNEAPRCCERPASPRVSIIVLNRNGAEPLAALFDSWERHNRVDNLEWIIVDHASTDESIALIERAQYRMPIHLIALPINDSFSASCNRAAAEARGRHLLFLNNDIFWVQDALSSMLHTLETDPDIGIVGLKLIRTADNGQRLAQAQVQHMGVRFKLAGTAYFPYEVTPGREDESYCAQSFPVVTGAVMLCRRDEFFACGEFSTDYFYGFEDVELCLRMQQRLNRRIVCCNDLVAFHRDGHTRLSGRALDIFDRQRHNSDALQRHAGLWLKQAYWRSLFSTDSDLTTDRLRIGIVVDCDPEDPVGTPLLHRAKVLAARISAQYLSANIVLLQPTRNWYDVRDLHILIVGSADYDPRLLRYYRSDLLVLAWLDEISFGWPEMPHWQAFDAGIMEQPDLMPAYSRLQWRVYRSNQKYPLGSLITAQQPPVRVAIDIPKVSAKSSRTELLRLAYQLRTNLNAEGAVAWLLKESSLPTRKRLADICITLHPARLPSKFVLKPQAGCLNVVWLLKPETASVPGFISVKAMPKLTTLRRILTAEINRAFR